MRFFSDQPENPSWASLGVTQIRWLALVLLYLTNEEGWPTTLAAQVVQDNRSAALSAYHNGQPLIESVRRIKELVK